MNENNRPLLQRFPKLARELAPGQLDANIPTPVQQLPEISDSLWVKRDDLTGEAYGGNKWRKLEFVLPYAMKRGAQRIITFGGLGTHHGLATAIACRELGLQCDILLFDQPLTPHVRENLRLMHYYGAKLHYYNDFLGSNMARVLAVYALHPRRIDPRTYFLFAGASNPIGVCAYVNAALELDQQITNGELPEPAAIYCAVGSTGTLAGLTLGLALCGRDIPVRGVRVIDSHLGPFAACTASTTQKLMRQTLAWMRGIDSTIPNLDLPTPLLLDDYFGEGYGTPTAAGERATKAAAKSGLALDPTYTAKAFAAALDGLDNSDEPILYWHTLSSAELAEPLAASENPTLPTAIEKRLRLAV